MLILFSLLIITKERGLVYVKFGVLVKIWSVFIKKIYFTANFRYAKEDLNVFITYHLGGFVKLYTKSGFLKISAIF